MKKGLQMEINEFEDKSSMARNVVELLILFQSVQYCFRQSDVRWG